jgi:NADH-quinone oxidoreductase subunit G
VLGNLLNLPSFDYLSSDEITDELRRLTHDLPASTAVNNRTLQSTGSATDPSAAQDIAIYQSDAIVRRAPALQATREAQTAKEQGA